MEGLYRGYIGIIGKENGTYCVIVGYILGLYRESTQN